MAVLGAAAVAAAAGIAKALIPTNTTTTSNGNGTSSSSGSSSSEQDSDVSSTVNSTTNTQQIINSLQNIFSTQDVKGTSDQLTTNDSVTKASADPDVIANLKQLAQTAINNSTDTSKTTGLISGILQTAGDAMTSIFGQQKQAGIYNGSTATVLANDTNARATADAASAVLGYQQGQQQIAGTALNQLLAATASSSTHSTSDVALNTDQLTTNQSTTSSQQTTGTTSTTDTSTDAQTHATSNANQNQNVASTSQTQSQGSSSASIVCTWMYNHQMLKRVDYYNSMQQFHKKGQYTRRGYLIFAKPLVAELIRDQASIFSQVIIWLFLNRTNYVCGRKSLSGFISCWLVILGCLPPGLYLIAKEQVLPRLKLGAIARG